MKKLIVHTYAISFNEEVLMPHFLKHYESFSEKIFIYDNFSDDKTRDICLKFNKVELNSFDTGNQIRDDVYLKLKNEIWKKSRGLADFVIVCDIDEFIYSKNISKVLELAYDEQVSIIKCEGYNMVSDRLPTDSSNLFNDYKFGAREVNFDKKIIFNPNLIDEINYGHGAHKCFPIGKIKYSRTSFALLHYKFISLKYIQERYRLFESRLSKYNRNLNLGYHYTFSRYKIKREFQSVKKKSENVIDKFQ